RELFTPTQLAKVLGSPDDIYWLSEEITRDRAASLREFLVYEVGVDEVTPDSVVPDLTLDFLSDQPDEWISSFYQFLAGQKAVLNRLLRNGTPFIRCDDQSHVPPKVGHLPQVFLPSKEVTGFRTVKPSVCSSPAIVDFLRSIGLSEPD